MSTADVNALTARVHAAVGALHPGRELGPLEVLPGGHSGLTYRMVTGDEAVVVKAVPPGRRSRGRHDVVRQARMLRALAGSRVPVPRLIAVETAEPAWFAMSWEPGEAVEPVLDGVTLAPGLARSRASRAAQTLAVLHSADPTPLLAEAVPVTPDDEVAKWTAVLHAGPEEFVPRGDLLADTLGTSHPTPAVPAIVHGDYRLGNILFEGAEPRAIVDWEIWSIGDPRVDLGYFGVFADHRNFPGIGTEVAELPSERELTEICLRAGGRDPGGMDWFGALGRFRMAAIMAHNLRRHREGRYDDPAQETLPPTIRALTEGGLELLHRATAGR